MKRAELPATDERTTLEDYPEYEEEYYYDDNAAPTVITICSTESTGRLATEWISCEARLAIPIEAIR